MKRHRDPWSPVAIFVATCGIGATLLACSSGTSTDADGGDAERPQEDLLVRVGNDGLSAEQLAEVNGQLGRYAQGRFAGEEGKRVLLSALTDTEVLAQAARRGGLEHDPRAQWAVVEEMAGLALAAEMERRVPVAEVAADREKLRAYYDAHPDEFALPERRSIAGVVFPNLGEAERAHAEVAAGTKSIDDLGEVVFTELAARDDRRYPGLHPLLFDADLEVGQVLDAPVLLGRKVLVARLEKRELSRAKPFEDPEVQTALVDAVRAPLVAEARAAYLAELKAHYGDPAVAPP